MISPSTLHDLLSGKRRGLWAVMFRGLARCLEVPVRWYIERRNRAFDAGRYAIYRAPAKVISVGNLTVGGTGKTPLVEWLARWLIDQGCSPVLISRGYGSRQSKANDEALELALQLPHVPHLQNPKRVLAAKEAVAKYPGSVLLLDDAFQHRWLHRDVDIVLLDALEPFGYEHLLPRGLLREPVEGLRRAQVIILSRADLIDEESRRAIRFRALSLAPQAIWAEAIHEPRELINAQGEQADITQLAGKRIAAFCGIGNPLGFRRTLERLGCEIVHWQEFADHHAYSPQTIAHLAQAFNGKQIDYLLCTRKDIVKISQKAIANIPLWAVSIGLRFQENENGVVELLRHAIS